MLAALAIAGAEPACCASGWQESNPLPPAPQTGRLPMTYIPLTGTPTYRPGPPWSSSKRYSLLPGVLLLPRPRGGVHVDWAGASRPGVVTPTGRSPKSRTRESNSLHLVGSRAHHRQCLCGGSGGRPPRRWSSSRWPGQECHDHDAPGITVRELNPRPWASATALPSELTAYPLALTAGFEPTTSRSVVGRSVH